MSAIRVSGSGYKIVIRPKLTDVSLRLQRRHILSAIRVSGSGNKIVIRTE